MTNLPFRETSRPVTRQSEAQRFECDPDREATADSNVRNASGAFLILLIIVVLPISALVPPFQSPDEFNHIKRAYLLSKGHVFLGATEGETGGDIDIGLLDYMRIFETIPFSYKEKVTQKMLRDSRKITWSQKTRFSPLPNTAVYFPLSYLPQAAALSIGEHSGLSVSHTYYLARTFALAATIAMLWVAMRLYPVPLPVYALFATPMIVFQMSSASLDAISFSMCVLAASLFMRAADDRFRFSRSMHITLFCCLFLLATARNNLLGVVWLPLVLYAIRRERLHLVFSCMLIAICVAWTLFAALTAEGFGIRIQPISPGGILLYYLSHIGEFFSVMYSTLASGTLLLSYWRMFVGVLGWIDTPLDWAVYWTFAIAFAALGIISVQTSIKVLLSPARLSLALGAVLSTMLLFLTFLLTFTMHPANFIGAIQGRYFYPMAIFLGFAFFDRPTSQSRIKAGSIIIVFLVVLCAAGMVPKLLGRYWVS